MKSTNEWSESTVKFFRELKIVTLFSTMNGTLSRPHKMQLGKAAGRFRVPESGQGCNKETDNTIRLCAGEGSDRGRKSDYWTGPACHSSAPVQQAGIQQPNADRNRVEETIRETYKYHM